MRNWPSRAFQLACALLVLSLSHLPRQAAAQCGPAPNYSQSKVVNVSQTCAPGTANNPTCNVYPNGCFLYAQYSAPNANRSPPYFLNGISTDDHRLAIPVNPCRGVEDVPAVSGCGGEDIWDWAWPQVNDPSKYGLAINPTNKRTQHQLHTHVAPVEPSLQAALAKIAADKKTSFVPISCTGGAFRAQAVGCTVNTSQTPSGPGIVARWENTNTIASFKPFENSPDKVCGTILVSKPTSSGFVYLHANDRAAECLLSCTKSSGSGNECQDKCQTNNLQCP